MFDFVVDGCLCLLSSLEGWDALFEGRKGKVRSLNLV